MAGINRDPNLSMPYWSRLEGAKIQPGQTIKIQGVQSGDCFEVDFVAGQDVQRSDMPLVLSAHRRDKKITFNDRKAGQLGKEIGKKDPFKNGDAVDLRIRIKNDRFQVFANMKNFAEFEYRQPLISITHMYISGDIELKNVSWGGKHYPVPYNAHVDGNFRIGKQLIVTGMPEKKAERFSVNLLNDRNEILFHCQIRFNQKSVVFNSKLAGQWGTEEVEQKQPIKIDTLFDIMVVAEQRTFQVYIDNEFFHSFSHRAEPSAIDRLSVEDDVELLGVYVK